MSVFTINHEEASNFTLIPEGVYEAVISEVEIKQFESGNKGIKATYTIRNDVNQAGRGQKVFDNMVASANAMFKFQQVGKAIGMPQGKNYETFEDVLADFVATMPYKNAKVTIGVQKYTKNGEERQSNTIKFIDASELGAVAGTEGQGHPAPTDADIQAAGVEIPWE